MKEVGSLSLWGVRPLLRASLLKPQEPRGWHAPVGLLVGLAQEPDSSPVAASSSESAHTPTR
jgi:hypothetical protein